MKRKLWAAIRICLALALVPAAMVAAQQTHKAVLSWTDGLNPAGSVSYSVYRATGLCQGTPSFTKLANAVTVLTYTDSTVTPGNYCYQVTATVGGVESAPSNTATGAVPAFAPTSLTVTVAQIQVSVPASGKNGR